MLCKGIARLALVTAVVFSSMCSMDYPRQIQAFTARNLAMGSQGLDVDELQGRLRLLGYYWEAINGDFNWTTNWAVRTFQYNFGLKVTGFVDLETKIKLVKATPKWSDKLYVNHTSTNNQSAHSSGQSINQSKTSSQVSGHPVTVPSSVNGLTKSDLTLMAHIVYAEARGEPPIGQIAVAAVVLNRFHDPKFPHSIPGIIYQPGAFQCVANGTVNLQPNQSAMNAVLKAVHGDDPSDGAIYYFNPITATSHWIWSRPEILQIGHHIFTK